MPKNGKIKKTIKENINTMNENLSEMVKEQTETNPAIFSENDLDLPIASEVESPATPQPQKIRITSLSNWFEATSDSFENINQVKVAIRGVDPTKTLIMAVAGNSGEKDEDGNPVRNLRVYENADTHPVLDMPAVSMDVYNNGFRILYQYSESISIKCYGIRTGLIVVFCNLIDGNLIPYSINRVKRKDEEIDVITNNVSEVTQKLNSPLDGESLQLRYKQASKVIDDFTTNKDAVVWLLERQSEITDINHHLQIDNIIIDTLA